MDTATALHRGRGTLRPQRGFAAAAAAAAITCDKVATGKDFYPGDPASDTDDTRVTASATPCRTSTPT